MTERDARAWDALDALFEVVLDRPPEEREAFLARACADDPRLREEVEALLEASEAADPWMEHAEVLIGRAAHEAFSEETFSPEVEVVSGLDDGRAAAHTPSRPRSPATRTDPMRGRRIGPWRILGRLARGGMGNVYLVERADGQFEQRAALKLLRRGLDTDDILRRFLAERGALAFVLRTRDELEEAERLYSEVLEQQESLLGTRNSEVARTLNNLGYLHRARNQYPRAESLYRRSLTVHEDIYGPGHPLTHIVRNNLASVLEYQGKVEETVRLLGEGVWAAEARWPQGHWRVGRSHQGLGLALLRKGEPAEAERSFREADRVSAEELGEEHPWRLGARALVGLALLAREDREALGWLDDTRNRLGVLTLKRRRQAGWVIERVAEWLEDRRLTSRAAAWRNLVDP